MVSGNQDYSDLRASTSEIVSHLKHCTQSELSLLKNQAIDLEKHIKAATSDDSTQYARKRVNELLHQLWAAVDEADRRLNLRSFQFTGEPIPPESKTVSAKKPIATDNKATEDLRAYEDIDHRSLFLDLPGQAVKLGLLKYSQISVCGVSSVHIEDAANCVIHVTCNGPVFVRGMANCILVAKSHQLRLHGVDSSVVFAECGRVVIEDCNRLRFGVYVSSSGALTGASYEVDDFSWPTKMSASPHYTKLDHNLLVEMPDLGDEWGSELWQAVLKENWLHKKP